MAIFSKGANPVALRQSAERLSMLTAELDGVASSSRHAVGQLKGNWGGGDLEYALTRWSNSQQALESCRQVLSDMSQALRRNAGDQERTSSADFGASGGGGVAPNPGSGLGAGGGGDHNPRNPLDGPGKYVDIGDIPMGDDSLEMDDIEQGQIGDCWLLAGLGPIAQNDPQFIRDHVSYDAEAGTYTVTLYRDGEPVDVVVDASVVENGARSPSGDPNYASIYEKAMASFMGGNYDDIDGGYTSDAFEAITGRDAERGGESNFDDIQAKLEDGQLMAVGTEGDASWWPFDDEVDNDEIVPNHAYMVAGIEERDGERRIHLINPWGPDGGSYEGKDKVGELWLTEAEYRENFDSTYSVAGKE